MEKYILCLVLFNELLKYIYGSVYLKIIVFFLNIQVLIIV